MKFGIIGAGMIGHFHAKAITAMMGGELQSVFDLRGEAAEKLAAEYGGKAYSDINEFLADPELEIVTIGTPSGAHLDPALAALNAGKHVICEKPLEITTERIDQLIEAAAKNGKTLSAVLNRRFHPGMDAFKKAADEGRFGKLTSASAYVKWFRDQAYYDSAGWRGEPLPVAYGVLEGLSESAQARQARDAQDWHRGHREEGGAFDPQLQPGR